VLIWGVTLGLTIVIVLVTRGRFLALARMRVRALWLLLAAAVLQAGIAFVSFPEARVDDVGFALLMSSYALLLAFCFANLGLRGMGVVLVGVGMNTVVIGLNGGMPATEDVWRDGEVVSEPFERTVKHKPETDEDLVPFLSDIILLPEPINEVISFGDLVLAVGVVDVVYWGSRRRRRKTAEEIAEEREAAEAGVPLEVGGEPVGVDVVTAEPVVIDLTEPESEPVPAGSADREPRPIEWTAPAEASIDLSAYERPSRRPRGRASDSSDSDSAPLEHSFEGE